MARLDWMKIVATVISIAWGLVGIYSGLKNDGKSRFLTLGGPSALTDKYDDQKELTRLKNLFWGLLSVGLGVGLLYIQMKDDLNTANTMNTPLPGFIVNPSFVF